MKIMLEYGELEITVDALKKIVYLATVESYGTVGIGESRSFFERIFGGDKGIKIEELEDSSLNVDVYIEVEYGVNIKEVAKNIADNVAHKLKTLAGCENLNITVHVVGIK
ncbi:Asp23/Gls24 family envelope stress response protein [Thermotoga sp.]|uniref:Asp23/Gls24 family envelope stress response protein n=1 Tax=Thermotoga sp. TaxID=28240 RepID=UPI0025D0AE0A|nr:Asp23/Gls24 family envelope stress response protein [Thermotoga sp.]MCD6550795.1 Asp23/Gls24 family envelope stress response protein [Thermotoga sp.]